MRVLGVTSKTIVGSNGSFCIAFQYPVFGSLNVKVKIKNGTCYMWFGTIIMI